MGKVNSNLALNPSIGFDSKTAAYKNPETSQRRPEITKPSSSHKMQPKSLALGNLVEDEINLRKKESLGLALSGDQRLGKSSSKAKADDKARKAKGDNANEWGCLVCTL